MNKKNDDVLRDSQCFTDIDYVWASTLPLWHAVTILLWNYCYNIAFICHIIYLLHITRHLDGADAQKGGSFTAIGRYTGWISKSDKIFSTIVTTHARLFYCLILSLFYCLIFRLFYCHVRLFYCQCRHFIKAKKIWREVPMGQKIVRMFQNLRHIFSSMYEANIYNNQLW